jgi:hypothetical protein
MEIKVRLRFNKRTGEIDCVVEAPDSPLPEAEHNRRHEQLAAEVGRILEQHPRVVEVTGEAAAPQTEEAPATPEAPATTPERRREGT